MPYSSAIRHRDLRPLTADERAERAAHHARFERIDPDAWVPFRLHVTGDQVIDGPEHAFDSEGTLCGIGSSHLLVMRHTFSASVAGACPTCADAADRQEPTADNRVDLIDGTWVPRDNVRALLETLSRWVRYDLDGSDWQARARHRGHRCRQ
jgi:hypothetical protein